MTEEKVHDCPEQSHCYVIMGQFANWLMLPRAAVHIEVNFCPFCGANLDEEVGTKAVMLDHYEHATLVAKLIQAQILGMRTDLLQMELSDLYQEHWKLKGYYEYGSMDESQIYHALKRVFSLNKCLSDADDHIRRIVNALRDVKGSMDVLEEETDEESGSDN